MVYKSLAQIGERSKQNRDDGKYGTFQLSKVAMDAAYKAAPNRGDKISSDQAKAIADTVDAKRNDLAIELLSLGKDYSTTNPDDFLAIRNLLMPFRKQEYGASMVNSTADMPTIVSPVQNIFQDLQRQRDQARAEEVTGNTALLDETKKALGKKGYEFISDPESYKTMTDKGKLVSTMNALGDGSFTSSTAEDLESILRLKPED